MAAKPLPTPGQLRQLLSYDPENGQLTWLERPQSFFEDGARSAIHKANNWNVRFAGKPALVGINSSGYPRGPVLGRYVLAHRVIWAMVTGTWPEEQIDHINGDRADNRWANLREATHVSNGHNIKRKTTNTSGHTGVYRIRDKWCARITVERKNIGLGHFDNIEDAAAARKRAEVLHGFTDSHGRR